LIEEKKRKDITISFPKNFFINWGASLKGALPLGRSGIGGPDRLGPTRYYQFQNV
jgi:hypothetical protein